MQGRAPVPARGRPSEFGARVAGLPSCRSPAARPWRCPIGSVVLVHGVRSSSQVWTRQAEKLRADGHHCVTVDLPGHGPRRDERYSLRAAAATIDSAVRSCPEPPLLVGVSLGGYSSLAYAAQHQGKLAGLVLVACTTEIRTSIADLYRRVSGQAVRLLRRSAADWRVVTDMLHALRSHSFLTDLRQMHRPVWLVNGVRDPMRLDERRYLRALPHATLTVVPRSGHDVHVHAPAAFARILDEALGTRPTVTAPA